jgi:4-hydroxybenzoate polyprenyltransferase
MLTSVTAQLEQQLRDYALDQGFDMTFAVRYGPALTQRLLRLLTAVLMTVVCIGLLSTVIPLILLPFGLFMLPILLRRFVHRGQKARSEALVRLTLVVALLYTSILWMQQIIF